MRETPDEYFRRTGCRVPVTDVSVAGPLLGTRPRPPLADESCPTLYRDVGPQALLRFIRDDPSQFEGIQSPCAFLRDATLPAYSSCVEQFGAIAILQPLSIGPWLSGQAGIWVSERGRIPDLSIIAIVPGGTSLSDLDRKIEKTATRAEFREALGGPEYDALLERSTCALEEYLADWMRVEPMRRSTRARLASLEEDVRRETLEVMESLGLNAKDFEANWFHLRPERRDFVRDRLTDWLVQLAGRP